MAEEALPPTIEEIQEYAKWLGMDLDKDHELLWIAEKGLVDPLPPNWKGCMTDTKDLYYFNTSTGESTWTHPNDLKYKNMFKEEKMKLQEKQRLSSMKGINKTRERAKSMDVKLLPPVKGGSRRKSVDVGVLSPKSMPIPVPGVTRSRRHSAGDIFRDVDTKKLAGAKSPLGPLQNKVKESVVADVKPLTAGLIGKPPLAAISRSISDDQKAHSTSPLALPMFKIDSPDINEEEEEYTMSEDEGPPSDIPERPQAPSFDHSRSGPADEIQDETEEEFDDVEDGKMALEAILSHSRDANSTSPAPVPAVVAQAHKPLSPGSKSVDTFEKEEMFKDEQLRLKFRRQLEEKRAQYMHREEKRQESAIDCALQERLEFVKQKHQRALELEEKEWNAQMDRHRREHSLARQALAADHEIDLQNMKKTWENELLAEQEAMERMKLQASEHRGSLEKEIEDVKSIALEKNKIEEERSRVSEEIERIRGEGAKEQHEIANAFAEVLSEQRHRLNEELGRLKSAHETEIRIMSERLEAERRSMYERKKAEMRDEVEARVLREAEVLRKSLIEREQTALQAMRKRADEAETRLKEVEIAGARAIERIREAETISRESEMEAIQQATAPAPLNIHQPASPGQTVQSRPLLKVPQPVETFDISSNQTRELSAPKPPTPEEGAGSILSSLRGEEKEIEQQEIALNERKNEIKEHRMQVEHIQQHLKHDYLDLREKAGSSDFLARKSVLDETRSVVECQARLHNKEVQQIKNSKKYLELRRKRVDLMKHSVLKSSGATVDLSGNISLNGEEEEDEKSEASLEEVEESLSRLKQIDLGRLDQEIACIDAQLAEVLAEMRQSEENYKSKIGKENQNSNQANIQANDSVGATALRLKYTTLFPNVINLNRHFSGNRGTKVASVAPFEGRMNEFKTRLVKWEAERESAVRQLTNHQHWLKRFSNQIKRHGIVVRRSNQQNDSSGGDGRTIGGDGRTIVIKFQ